MNATCNEHSCADKHLCVAECLCVLEILGVDAALDWVRGAAVEWGASGDEQNGSVAVKLVRKKHFCVVKGLSYDAPIAHIVKRNACGYCRC